MVCHTGLLTACEQDQDGTACISASSWFYYKKFNTIHGQMNIKFINIFNHILLLFLNVHLLFYHISKQHSVMHTLATYRVQ